jgi:EAL domain-containing protein (putative c-di-GMP-specific phosphodiesterase class I)
MLVVADGVETPQEAALLGQMGANCMQGYLYGVPRFDL